MAVAWQTRRVTLVANVALAITPPSSSSGVKIGNGTADDLRVYSDPNDDLTYFVIAAGFEKEMGDTNTYFRFDPYKIAFHLKALASGTAVLIWY